MVVSGLDLRHCHTEIKSRTRVIQDNLWTTDKEVMTDQELLCPRVILGVAQVGTWIDLYQCKLVGFFLYY